MVMRNRFLAFLLLLSLLTCAAQAQTPTPTPTDWKLTGKTGSTEFTEPVYLYADSSVMIAIYFSGVFRSTDKGKTWTSSVLGNYSTKTILRVGSALIAASAQGFWRSTDNGATWRTSNGGLSAFGDRIDILSLTLMNGVIYAGAGTFFDRPACFLSRDEGLSWVAADKGLDAAENGISIAGLNGSLVYGDRNGKLFRSTDGAQNWAEITSGYELGDKPVVVANHRYFFVANNKGVFRSDNYGASWVKVLNRAVVANAAAMPSANIATRGRTVMVIAGTGNSLPPGVDLYVSKDNGQTWAQTFAPYAQDNNIITGFYAIAFGDKAYMLARGNAYVNDKVLPPALGLASAASFDGTAVAPDSIAVLFGTGLATAPQAARTIPLPTTIDGVRVKLWDSTGNETFAPLFYVSPTQINFQVPPNLPAGVTVVTAELNNVVTAEGQINLASLTPGIFTANANGQGCPAGYFVRVRNGVASNEAAITFDTALRKFVTSPLDLGPDTDQLFLVLFGTGIRANTLLSNVTATINQVNADVLYAGTVKGLVGLDQINLRVPRSLKGLNREVDVVVSVAGKATNTIKISVK